MATKRFRNWFFQITSVLRRDGTTGGVRFLIKDKPTEDTMKDFSESIAFMKESSDRAKPYTGATDLGTEQGLSVLATDAQAKSNAAQLEDRSLVTQPHQLPTAENLDAAALEDMEVQTLDITAEAGTTTRNRYQFRLNLGWLTWLFTRIFKQGGVEGDVPLKNSATNYDWSYGNVGDNTTTVNKIANNADFINTLLANSTFVNSLTTQIITNNPTAIVDALPVATILIRPMNVGMSSKWLKADGSAISRTTYSDLFAIMGTAYGAGDGSTTFNLPNYSNKTVRADGVSFGISTTGGSDEITIGSAANLPALTIAGSTNPSNTELDGEHSHTYGVSGTSLGGAIAQTLGTVNTDVDYIDSTALAGDHIHGIPSLTVTGTVNGTGASTPITSINSYIVQAFFIKVLI